MHRERAVSRIPIILYGMTGQWFAVDRNRSIAFKRAGGVSFHQVFHSNGPVTITRGMRADAVRKRPDVLTWSTCKGIDVAQELAEDCGLTPVSAEVWLRFVSL